MALMVRHAAVALVYAAIEQTISHVAPKRQVMQVLHVPPSLCPVSPCHVMILLGTCLGADIETSATKQLQNISRANEVDNRTLRCFTLCEMWHYFKAVGI